MTEGEPVPFDLPGHDQSLPDPPSPGRRRETWACTVAADVTIHDADAVRNAAERAQQSAVAVGLSADPTVGDPEVDSPTDPFDILAWLVWPTDGLEELLEAGAFRILELNSEVAPGSDEACVLSWTVTVKPTDVAALRRIAIRARPDEAEQIRGSLALAWQHAADPFAPLREIPGITWQPRQVAVRHVPRRSPADNTAGER